MLLEHGELPLADAPMALPPGETCRFATRYAEWKERRGRAGFVLVDTGSFYVTNRRALVNGLSQLFAENQLGARD